MSDFGWKDLDFHALPRHELFKEELDNSLLGMAEVVHHLHWQGLDTVFLKVPSNSVIMWNTRITLADICLGCPAKLQLDCLDQRFSTSVP